MSNCKIKKKDSPYSDNNRIGINLGGWICIETWIHDTKYYMPQIINNNGPNFKNPVSNGNNYQRAELGTIREINNNTPINGKISNTPGNPSEDWSSFNYNIPPTNRVEPISGGAKDFMSMHWATFLSTKINNTKSVNINDLFDKDYNIKISPEEIFGILLKDDILKRFNLFRIPIGYWTFSKWISKDGESIYDERSPYESKDATNEPPLWYNNEGFLTGPKGPKQYLKILLNLIKKYSADSKVILDLHALAGVQAANSDFAGWNTGVVGGLPKNNSYISGTWITTDNMSIVPINNDNYRKTNKINWVYPGPCPGKKISYSNCKNLLQIIQDKKIGWTIIK